MSNVYVLLMVWATSSTYGGVGTVQQEFSSMEACEVARKALEPGHNGSTAVIRSQGCFKK